MLGVLVVGPGKIVAVPQRVRLLRVALKSLRTARQEESIIGPPGESFDAAPSSAVSRRESVSRSAQMTFCGELEMQKTSVSGISIVLRHNQYAYAD